jgi:isocitrate dehydrogenase
MSVTALKSFFDATIAEVASEGTLFSLHMKATMMKVSDPIIFGHCVRQYLAPVFEKHGAAFDAAGISPNAGLGDMLTKIGDMDDGAAIVTDINATLAAQPPLYMVNSDTGITNLHVPSDVIIDASMPSIIRAGGKGWGPDGAENDTTCVIPDSSYAGVYSETIAYFKETGALDPVTAGTVQNVGLMAQKAEEYGSHPTTFEIAQAGTVKVMNGDTVLMSHAVEAGDIWRMASTRKAPIENWIDLAIERQAAENCRAIFWLDASRAHDAALIKYVTPILIAKGVAEKFEILAPIPATRASFMEIREGHTTIAVTGNVLRDYLTDLFPILEVGTSAKMLSVVKLMQGGGLFETGAGGSAPKHVQQLIAENHLRWDSLGEFCALGESLRFAGTDKARALGLASDQATEKLLSMGKSPGRKVGQDDNRSSHFYFALYWAEALATQTGDADLAAAFGSLANKLADNADEILAELKSGAGKPVDLGGYFHTDPAKTAAVMRPSATFNALID